MTGRHAHSPRGAGRAAVATLLGGSLLSGLMFAGLALPVVGAAGSMVKAAATYWNDLPSRLPQVPASQGSVLLASDGKTELATLFRYNRQVVPLASIAVSVRQAVVAIEDSRFYSNAGLDLRGTARALLATASGGGVQGGSSITQQYVKNVLLDQAGDVRGRDAASGRSLTRKIKEARYALALGRSTTKDEVLAGYLNIAYFGAGAYGVEAAAERYFSTSAARLTVAQSALLAGLVQNPNGLNPLAHPEAAFHRRAVVLARMEELGVLSPAARRAADRERLTLRPSYPAQGCSVSSVPFYCDWVYAQLLADPALGSTPDDRRRRLLEGGLRVVTGLSPSAQRAAQGAVDVLPHDQRVAAVAVLVEPGTGLVRAMAVNRDYGLHRGQTVFPLASVRAFQPGSTFKTFALAAALESGVALDTRLPGGDRYRSTVLDNPAAGTFTNAADGHGTNLTLTQATAESVNTAYVQLEERIGVLAVADAARRAGLELPDSGPHRVAPHEGSLVLGTRETSPVELAAAYAAFAAHGLVCPPGAVLRITDSAGHRLPEPRSHGCHQRFTPALADTVTSVLTAVLEPGGTGEAAALPGRPAAGKTGTTENEATAWFVGYTPHLAGAVMLADPRGPQQHPLHDVAGVRDVYGGTIPAQIWHTAMAAALSGQPVAAFPGANPAYLFAAAELTMPALAGMPSDVASARLRAMGLAVRSTQLSPPDAIRTMVPSGTVIDTVPGPGSPASPGSVVTVRVAR